MRLALLASVVCGFALSTLAQITPGRPDFADPKMLLAENAYNPVPSPDGRFIAYVRTGWGEGPIFFGTGRASLVSDVGLMDSSGKVLSDSFARGKFLAAWSPDSKAVLCYRDGSYDILTPDGVSLEAGEQPINLKRVLLSHFERVALLNDVRRPIFLEDGRPAAALRVGRETLLRFGNGAPSFFEETLIATSPNGRYITMMSARQPAPLWIYDRQLRQWTNPGEVTISPDRDWDYMKPAWDPWFADSAHLVFFSGRDLIICSPDGSSKRVLLTADRPAGLAVPSPNGDSVAYVSFQSRPMKIRPDLQFWGDTAVWVIATAQGSAPHQLTRPDPDTSSGLRWAGNDSLVFDRIAENTIMMHARIWEVAVR